MICELFGNLGTWVWGLMVDREKENKGRWEKAERSVEPSTTWTQQGSSNDVQAPKFVKYFSSIFYIFFLNCFYSQFVRKQASKQQPKKAWERRDEGEKDTVRHTCQQQGETQSRKKRENLALTFSKKLLKLSLSLSL